MRADGKNPANRKPTEPTVDSRAASCRVISEGNAATVQSQRGAACDKMRPPVTGAESEKSHKQALF